MLKRYILTIIVAVLLFAVQAQAQAQTLSVESFKLLESDLTANTTGTQERDQNGQIAALIKVVTSETGFVFDGGMMGVVKTIQKTGEIWVYVPAGIQKITIQHQQLGVLRDYYFPSSIEKARTYELKLISGKVRTIVEPEQKGQFVVFSVTPPNATVYIDGQSYSLNADGQLQVFLQLGKYEYRVESPTYFPDAGTLHVGTEKINKNVTLKSSKATLTVKTDDSAEIWINEEKKGLGTWNGTLAAGTYIMEARKESHRTSSQVVKLKEQEVKTISLATPTPIYGSLQIVCNPIECDVILDGKKIGSTPIQTRNEILIGDHKLEIRKYGYGTYSTTVNIKELETTTLNAELKVDKGKLTITSNPSGSTVIIDGKNVGNTPLNLDYAEGTYNIIIRKKGYKDYTRYVNVVAGKTVSVNCSLDRVENTKSTSTTKNTTKTKSNNREFLEPTQFGLSIGAKVPVGILGGADLYLNNLNIGFELETMNYASSKQEVLWTENQVQTTRIYSGMVSNFYGGYGIALASRWRITPQVGFSYTRIHDISDSSFDAPQKTYVTGLLASLKNEVAISKHWALVQSLNYGNPLSMGNIAERLNELGLIDKWCKGFSFNVSLEFVF